jgi:pilus assembly protein FimV
MPIRFSSPRLLSLLTLCATLSTPAVHAVGLGEVISLSAIGQPLRVEIRLPGERPERAQGCVRLVADPGHSADGIVGVPKARIAIRHAAGEAVAVITDPASTSQPILRLRLEEICDSNLQREYLLLLSEPPEITAPAQAPAEVRSATPSVPRPAGASRPRAGKGYVLWSASGNESLADLVARRHPGDAAAQARLVARIQQANPERFGPLGAGPGTRLAAGTRLLIPRERPIQAAAPQAARSAEPARPAATASTPQPAKAPPTKADQLVVEGRETGTGTPLKLARELGTDPSAAPPSEGERDLMRREQKLQTTVEAQIAMQADVAQRLRKLEALQAELRTRLTEAPAAEPAAPTVAAPLARPPRPQSPAWPVVLALLGGAAVAAGWWYRRRQPLLARPARSDRPVVAGDRPAAADHPVISSENPEAAAAPWERSEPPPESEALPTSGEPAPPPAMELLDWEAIPPSALDRELFPTLGDEELLAEHDSVIELAEIMLSFGRVHGAAETLAEFIRVHPHQSVAPWVKLLEVYRAADMQPEFEALSQRLNQTFNVVSITWDNFEDAMRRLPARLEDMPHLMERIEGLWGSPECLRYMDKLLRDNREGTRQGFAIGVADDLLVLIGVLDYRLRLDEARAAT